MNFSDKFKNFKENLSTISSEVVDIKKIVYFDLRKEDYNKIENHSLKEKRKFNTGSKSQSVTIGIERLREKLKEDKVELPTLNNSSLPTFKGRRKGDKSTNDFIKTSFSLLGSDVDFMYRYIKFQFDINPNYVKRDFISDIVKYLL